MDETNLMIDTWSNRLRGFIPDFLASSPALADLRTSCAVVFHGSTTLGIDDAWSDLDLWLLVSAEQLQQAEGVAGTRFFGFALDGKQGHFNLETVDEATERVCSCDLERIAELRRARVLFDPDNIAARLVTDANRPMSDAVRQAWFRYHYVEMRGYHRNSDNPMERGDTFAVLQGLTAALGHAIRAAIVLDRHPYPYIKWLGRAAADTPTGRQLLPVVDDIFSLLSSNALRLEGPESANPISTKLREIRKVLIDRARSQGLDEPWLDRWWEHLTQAREGIGATRW